MLAGMSNNLQKSSPGLPSIVTPEGIRERQAAERGESEIQGLDNSDVEDAGWSSGFEDSDDDMFGGPF